MPICATKNVEKLIENDTSHLRPGYEHGGEGGPLVGYRVVAHQLLHVPPAVGAAPHDVDQALVGHNAHTEPGLLHRTLHPPLIQTWIE